jgi:uncharacterized protein
MIKKLLGFEFKFDKTTTLVTIATTLLIIVDRYHKFTSDKAYDRIILYLVIPAIIIYTIEKKSLADYGFKFGNWKLGLTYLGLAILVFGPILYYVIINDPDMISFYTRKFTPNLPLMTALDLFGWEFVFRGWVLFAYYRKFGDDALWLQAVPFALAHLGKPEVETLSTIFGGFLFGVVALRTKSFIYPFLIHWFVATFVILVAISVS